MPTLDQRIKGGLFGFALGDALGATTEFMHKDDIKMLFGTLKNIVGGGWLQLKAGEVTDDTEMMIAVAAGIMEDPNNPKPHITENFVKWYTNQPKDIGGTVGAAIASYIIGRTTNPHVSMTDCAKWTYAALNGKAAGNGGLMRVLPVAIAYQDTIQMFNIATTQAQLTHADFRSDNTCMVYCETASLILNGFKVRDAVEEAQSRSLIFKDFDTSVRPTCEPSGYVIDTLYWVLHHAYTAQSYGDAVVAAANMGGDADTISALVGGLWGLSSGYEQLPKKWLNKLDRSITEQLNDIADGLQYVRHEIKDVITE